MGTNTQISRRRRQYGILRQFDFFLRRAGGPNRQIADLENRLSLRLPKIRLQPSGFVLKQRAQDFGRPLTGGEYEAAGQIEGRILLVRAGLLFERLLALPLDDAANSCPIDRARAHRAGFGGGVEGAAGEELEAVGPRHARGDEALGVGGAGKLQTGSKLVA
jgi:hypothetical protein